MEPRARAFRLAEAAGEPAETDRPFQGPGLLIRVAPFAGVAILAEASLALPPGPSSAGAVLASVGLLVLVAGLFLLPWRHLPAWMTVLVPLGYTGSVLALILAAGPASGVGIVLLAPLLWTALFHQRWESGCMIIAIVLVNVVISLTPVAVPGPVLARRVLFWAALAALISVASHGLRDRACRSREAGVALQRKLRDVSVLEDRERIADDLKDKVIQRIFASGLGLQAAAGRSTDPEVRRRIAGSVDELDQAVRMIRDAIFGLERRLHSRGLRQEILDLCGERQPAPQLTFSGPVDGALFPTAQLQLLSMLREALGLLGPGHPARIDISAGDDTCIAVIQAMVRPAAGGPRVPEFAVLRDSALRAGVSMAVDATPDGVRLAWQIPLAAAPSGASGG